MTSAASSAGLPPTGSLGTGWVPPSRRPAPRGAGAAGRVFPSAQATAGDSTGLLNYAPGEGRMYLLALGLALAFTAFIEALMLAAPVPPGGDEGQWLATSYVYVGLPYPSQILPFSYPLASFVPYGILVRLAGNPLLGTRLFVGLLATLIGVSSYTLGRALFHRPALALLAEAAILVQPDFDRLYFFGSYPTLFGFVFFFLAVAFAVRFVRSGNGAHAFVFWVSFAIALLSESLDGVMLADLVVLFGFFVLLHRRLPRELFTSRGSLLGFLVFVLFVGGFYLGTRLGGVVHPNYLQTGGALASRSLLPALVAPFHIETVASLFHHGFPMSTPTAIAILAGIALALFVALVVLSVWKTRYYSTAAAAVGAWLLAPILLALAATVLNIVTDYRRFAYFLYPAMILGLFVVLDIALDRYVRVLRERAAKTLARRGTVLPDSPVGSVAGVAVAPRAVGRPIVAVSAAVAIAVLLATAAVWTFPTAQNYESVYTTYGHSSDFLSVMDALRHSPIPGSVMALNVVDSKWIRALTYRNAYEPTGPGGYVFLPSQLLDNELAYYALFNRYAVTNQYASAAVDGTNASTLNGTPDVSVYIDGTPVATIRFPASGLLVQAGVPGGKAVWLPAFVPNRTTVHVALPPSTDDGWFGVTFLNPGYTVTENVSALPVGASTPIPTVQVAWSAQALAPRLLYGIEVNLSSPYPNGTNAAVGPNVSANPAQFKWATFAYGGKINTTGFIAADATPVQTPAPKIFSSPGVLASVQHYRYLAISSASSNGTASVALSVRLATTGTSNVLSKASGFLPSFISAPSIWARWNARFVVLDNIANGGSQQALYSYLTTEYGASFGPGMVSGNTAALLLPVLASEPRSRAAEGRKRGEAEGSDYSANSGEEPGSIVPNASIVKNCLMAPATGQIGSHGR